MGKRQNVREIKVSDAGQDECFGFDGLHGGFEVAVVGFLGGDIAGLPGVEHGEEVFGIWNRVCRVSWSYS